MNPFGKVRRWLDKGDNAGEAIARLLLVAKEDAAFKRQLEGILRLASHHRGSLLNDAVHQMYLHGEPASFQAAFAVLATDEGAAAALRVIGDEPDSPDASRDPDRSRR
jgi:hypothetical protein